MGKLISTYDAIRFPLIPKKLYLGRQAKRASRKGEKELGLLRFLVPENCNAIDGGAHKGIYSYYLARLCNRVHAFEPNPTMYAYLESAVPKNVTPYNIALSDFTGSATFHIPTSRGRFHHTGGSLLEVSGPTGAAHVDVTVKTIDSYQFENIGFIKLDLEGHELGALKGGIELLRKYRPVVLAEVKGVGGSSPAEVVSFMESLDYIPLVFREGKIRYFGGNTAGNITHNCIFMPDYSWKRQ